MLVIVSTPGAANANSYTSEAEANAYHESVVDSTVWDDADPDARRRALVSATRAMDSQIQWVGRAVSANQSLAWPRYNAVTRQGFLFDSAVIPPELKDATAELARRLIESGGSTGTTADDTLKSLKAGPVDLVFNTDATPTVTSFPDEVFRMVSHLARMGPSSGIRSVPLVRT